MRDTAAAERTILGAIIIDNALIHSVPLIPAEFSDRFYSRVFGAMKTLSEKSEPIDLVTLNRPLFPYTYLNSAKVEVLRDERQRFFALAEGMPPLSNIDAWVNIVRQAATEERLGKALKAAAEADDPRAQIETVEAALASYGATPQAASVPVAKLAKETFAKFEAMAQHHGMIGLPTGFAGLDRILCGIKPADVIIVAARPSCGKTSLATQIARGSSARTLFVSIEMSSEAIVRRMISAESGVNQRAIQFGLREREWGALATAASTIWKLPLWLNDAVHTLGGIRREAKRIGDLELIVIDYLQLMESDAKAENRQQSIAAISRGLKTLAKELNVPIIALSQLSRPGERKDKRPQLTDLRESGAIEQDADVVLLIYREEMHAPTEANRGKAEIIVAKQREGDIGTCYLNWDKTTTRFFEDQADEPTQESLL